MDLGINLWPQNTTWPSMRERAILADRLGFDSLWVWDHFYAIVGDTHRPNFEGWQIQPAYAAITQHVKIGCLVSSITHRPPAVLANMATTSVEIPGRSSRSAAAGSLFATTRPRRRHNARAWRNTTGCPRRRAPSSADPTRSRRRSARTGRPE